MADTETERKRVLDGIPGLRGYELNSLASAMSWNFFSSLYESLKAFAFERRSCYRQNRLLSAANEAKPSPYSGSALTPQTSVKWLFGPPSYSASVEPPARFEPGECSSPETSQIYRDQISLIYEGT